MGKNKTTEQLEALEEFIERGVIDDVAGVVKSGKEATVYLCESRDGLVAAKVYRSTEVRRFAHDAMYREGRLRRKNRYERAIAAKGRAGREFAFAAWVGAEYDTLATLHRAGANVPRPIGRSEQVVLMEYLGDEETPAPLLNQAQLAPVEAERALASLLDDIETALAYDRVHGDLSPFNVLWWRGRPVLIDFPQAIDPRFNSSALTLLQRDIDRICAHFERYGILRDAHRIARDLWSRFLRSEL